MAGNERRARYWRANLRILVILLSIWFGVSFGLGILLVEPLNRIHIGGFPLGFWFAQQGSIYVFIGLIWVYARFSAAPMIVAVVVVTALVTGLASITRGGDRNERLMHRAALFALGAALVILPVFAGDREVHA